MASSPSSTPLPLSLLPLSLLLLLLASSPPAAAQEQQLSASNAAGKATLIPWRSVARAWAARRDCDETFVAQLERDDVVVAANASSNSTGSGLAFACLRDADKEEEGSDGDKKDTEGDSDNQELLWRVGLCSLTNLTSAAMFRKDAEAPALSIEPFSPGAPSASRTEPLTLAEDTCMIVDGRADEQSAGTDAWSSVVKDLRDGRVFVAAKTVEDPGGAIRGQLERLDTKGE